jgi:GxxExxY protein
MALQTDPLVQSVLQAAIAVHRALGPGLFESVYKACLLQELERAGIQAEREVALPVIYRDTHVPQGFRLDLLVERRLIIEVKSLEVILPVHDAQVVTYLRLSGLKQGLLLNFNVPRMKDGIRSFLNTY